MTTFNSHGVRDGDLVTLEEEGADGVTVTTYRFVDVYDAADVHDSENDGGELDELTAGSAIGRQLVAANVGDTLTISHLGHTFTVRFVAVRHPSRMLR